MEREDELQTDASLQLVNIDDHNTEYKRPKREAVASSYMDSDGPYEDLCSQVCETPVITDKRLEHNHAMSHHLCEDLIDEIFIRLPVKSLVRNTSLSKSWRSRISTPSFIRKHTLRSATTQLLPQKYFLRKHVTYFLHSMGYSAVCDLLDKGYNGLKSDKCLGYCFEIVGSCNGIVCLFNKGVISLWNPSIRRKVTVPAYPASYKRVSFGFGFDPISNDYKIVAMPYSYYEDAQSFIYSVKTNSWSKIVPPAIKVFGVSCESHDACLLNGKLHWVVRCELNDITQCCLITFDLSTNVFGFISLPYPSLRFYNPKIIKGRLAVMCLTRSRDGGSRSMIWSMREYNNVASWTKAFNISKGIHRNKDHKDSISYNHETWTRSRLTVDTCYTFDMDMCVESLELFDKEIIRDESYFLHDCSQLHCV